MNNDYSEEEWQLQEFITETIGLVGSVAKLAEIAGVSARTVYAWKKGERHPNRQNLRRLRSYLDTVAEQTESSTELYFPHYSGTERRGTHELSGRHDTVEVQPDSNGSTFLAPPSGPEGHQDEFIFVDKAEARPSAGGGSLATSDSSDGRYAFRLDWILHKTQDANSLKIMEVMGRSMESTLHNGDLCLVNQSDKNLVEDRVYVVRLDDEIYVKRFSRIPGKYLFRGDNRELAYQDIEIDPRDESRSWEVIGRVIWAGKDL